MGISAGKIPMATAAAGDFIPRGEHWAHQQAQENYVDEFAGKHIGPQPDGERQDARGGADNFHGKQ